MDSDDSKKKENDNNENDNDNENNDEEEDEYEPKVLLRHCLESSYKNFYKELVYSVPSRISKLLTKSDEVHDLDNDKNAYATDYVTDESFNHDILTSSTGRNSVFLSGTRSSSPGPSNLNVQFLKITGPPVHLDHSQHREVFEPPKDDDDNIQYITSDVPKYNLDSKKNKMELKIKNEKEIIKRNNAYNWSDQDPVCFTILDVLTKYRNVLFRCHHLTSGLNNRSRLGNCVI